MAKKLIILTILAFVISIGRVYAADNAFDDNVVIGASSASDKLHVEGGGILQKVSSAPTHVGSITGNGSPNYLNGASSVYVSGNYAYVVSDVDDALTIFDVSNPSSPTYVGALAGAGSPNYLNGAHSVFVSGNYAYVAASNDNALTIIDVSDPSSPTHAGYISGSGSPNYLNLPYSVYVSGRYAYVASAGSDALTIFDISDPTNPAHVGAITYAGDATYLNGADSVYVSGEYAYVTSFMDHALSIIDVSDPSNPTEAGTIAGSGSPNYLMNAWSVYVSGRYAYVAALGNSALTIFDISDPSTPTHVGAITGAGSPNYLSSAYSVYVSGDYAYVAATGDTALTVIDVSDPSSPAHAGTISGSGSEPYLGGVRSVYVSGKYAYLTGATDYSLTIIDVFGIDASSASIGDISASTIDVTENLDVGNNLYVRSGLNVGSRGIMTDGELTVGGESYFVDKVGVNDGSPSYDLSVAGTFGIRETTGATYYSAFQGGDQSANITYTLPDADGGSGDALSTNGSGVLSWNPLTVPSGSSNQTLYHDGDRWVANSILINNDTNVGVGDTSPAALLTVGDTDLFQVNSSGAIAAAEGITSSGTITFSGLSTDGPVFVASGALSSEAQLAASRGGLGADFSSTVQGNTFYTNNGPLLALAPGTAGQVLETRGTGVAPAWDDVSTNTTGPTLVIAASDSDDGSRADYVCNGSNDEATIEAAIAALPSGGGTIKLLDGTYTIESDIDITKSNVSLIGSGKSTILERNWDAASYPEGPVIIIGDGGTTAVSGVVVSSLAIDGQDDTYSGTENIGIGFYFDVSQTKIENNWIYDCDGQGINVYGATGGNENLYIHILGNDIRNNDWGGIKFIGSTYSVIANNIIENNYVSAIQLDNGASYNTVTGNVTSNHDFGYGVYLTLSSHCNAIAGNVFYEDYSAIYVSNSDYNTFSGNIISDTDQDGIYITGADYNVLTGNSIYNSGSHSVTVNASDFNLLSSNSIYDTAGSTYAINISVSTADDNYLLGNYYSGTGATSINDSGTGTIIQNWNEFRINGTLQANRFLVEEADSGITLTSDDFGKTISVDSSSSQTVMLPSVDSSNTGAWIRVLKLNSGQVTVDAADSDTIADSTAGGTIYNSQSGQDYAVIEIQLANETEWVVVHGEGTWSTN